MVHFWWIFFRGSKKWGWRAFTDPRTGEVIAYRTRKEAREALTKVRDTYAEACLYKFKPEAFIFGACK